LLGDSKIQNDKAKGKGQKAKIDVGVAEGVEADGGASFGGFGAAAFSGVAAVGIDLAL
jgi:hypothetical protein